MSEIDDDLQGPLDLTDRLTLARWMARVRGHVSALERLLSAVPEMPYLHVQVFQPKPEPLVTLQHLLNPRTTVQARILGETEQQIEVQTTNGEIYRFSRKTGEELPNPAWPDRPLWRLVPPETPASTPPTPAQPPRSRARRKR